MTAQAPPAPPWEPTAWLRDADARRLAQLTPTAREAGSATILTTLTGSRTTAGTREDRTCDRCEVYVPPTKPGRPVAYFVAWIEHSNRRGGRALIVVGLCKRCADAEGWAVRSEVVA